MKIKFASKYIYLKQMETLFAKNWGQSRQTSDQQLTFDFTSVQYMDLMQICQVFLWIENLLIARKSVHLIFCKKTKDGGEHTSKLFSVAYNYGFFTVLSRYEGLVITPKLDTLRTHLAQIHEDAPLIHLTLFDKPSSLEEFLAKENTGDHWKSFFPEHSETIRTNLRTAVRNIVLREVAGNVFVHAGSVPAILAVSRKNFKQLAQPGNPEPIRNFVGRSNVADYIQIIVGDFGLGIPSKLRPSFMQDPDACKIFSSSDAANVIEYSFWKDSSSRRRQIEEALDGDQWEELIPPTGLYFVKKLAERLGGMICVRSSNTIWCNDYTLGSNPTVSASLWDVPDFVEMPGNVIQIILPVSSMQDTLHFDDRPSVGLGSSVKFSNYISWSQVGRIQSDEKSIASTIIKLVRAASIRADINEGILVDLNKAQISSKRLFQIAVYLMYRQEKNRPIVLVNVPEGEAWREVCDQIKELHSHRALRPVYWFSTIGQGTLGALPSESDTQLGISYRDMQNFMLDALSVNVTERIRTTYQESAKVFLPAPSSRYVLGFFHLPEILSDNVFCSNFVSLVLPSLSGDKFVAVVTTSSRLIELAKMFADELKFPVENVYYQASDRPPTGIVFDLAKLPREAVLILSDAVVTGHTVSRIKNFIPNKTVVVTLVADSHTPDVIAGVRHSFDVYERKPKEWDYDEIRPISSATHQFLEPLPAQNEDYVSEEILGQWADSDLAVAVGHFSNERTCYLVFFDTYRLQRLHGAEILEFIRVRLGQLRQKIAHRPLVYGYPVNNSAAEKICSELKEYIGGTIEPVAKSGVIAPGALRNQQILVFIDTAASTTRTIRRAMETASRKGYELLLIFIVINRARNDEYEFVQGIETFNKVDVLINSQFRAELPAYDRNNCPACQRKKRIEEEARKSIPASIRLLLEEEARYLELVPIQEARTGEHDISPKIGSGYGKALVFRQALERAGSGHTLAERETLLQLISDLTKMPSGITCLVDVLWLEADVISKATQHGRFWDVELSETLVSKCLEEMYKGNTTDYADKKALWVAAGIDFDLFIDILDVDKWKITEDACTALVCAIFIYRDQSTRDRSILLLRKVSTRVESRRNQGFSQKTITALREASNSLELEPYVERSQQETFTESIRMLWRVFYQKGSSHSKIRRCFDDARRLILPDDLPNCIKHAVSDDESFINIFKRDLLPALQVIRFAFPEDLLADAPYIAGSMIVNDLNSFKSDLEIASSAHREGTLSDDDWESYKQSIHETTNRILHRFIETESSELYNLLSKCEARVGEILCDIEFEVQNTSASKIKLLIQEAGTVWVPKAVVHDLCRTVLTNAIAYSESGADIVCELFEQSGFSVVATRSVPKGKLWPKWRKNHGLFRAQETLLRFGGWLRLPETTDERKALSVVEMGFPLARRVK